MAIELSEFQINRAVLEVRYPEAFLLWDRSGAIFSELQACFPDLKLKNAQPNQQVAQLRPGVEFTCQTDLAFVIVGKPDRDLSQLKEVATTTFQVLRSCLNLKLLTRIGHRIFYHKNFKTAEEASAFVTQGAPALARTGRSFKVDGKVLEAETRWKWEGEVTGCNVRFLSASQKLNFELPMQFDESDKAQTLEEYLAIVDVDYYAHADTPIERFDPASLIEAWSHLVRRDVGGFIRGDG